MALNLRELWHACVPSGTRTIYVSAANGSDSNNGLTSGTAYQSITAAVTNALAGDRILVDNSGTYGYVNIYGVSGTYAAWISIESLNDSERPLISVADNSGDDGFDIQQANYLGLYGFEVEGLQTSTNTSPSGICIFRGCSWIRVWNCNVHDFPGGCINCFYTTSTVYNGNTLPAGSWDCVDLCFNTLHDSCKYNPYNTSGISFFAAQDTTNGGTLDGRYAYRAIGNYIYNCQCLVDNTPEGFNYVTDGNGMSFDSLAVANSEDAGSPAYTKRGLAEANIVVGCGGRGLTIYNTINVDDLNNTYIGNLITNSPSIDNGMETQATYNPTWMGSNGVLHANNLILPLNTNYTNDGISIYTGNVILGGTQAVAAGDTDMRSTGFSYFSGLTQPELTSLQLLNVFMPITTTTTTRQTGAAGYQALGNGPRKNTQWAAGALETFTTRVFS